MFGRVTDVYVGFSAVLMRKAFVSLLLLVVLGAGAVMISRKLPTSFLPNEDQGYMFVAMQLPDAASLQRTSEAARDVEHALRSTPGIQAVTTVVGFSLLSFTQQTYSAFFFVTLKPW